MPTHEDLQAVLDIIQKNNEHNRITGEVLKSLISRVEALEKKAAEPANRSLLQELFGGNK